MAYDIFSGRMTRKNFSLGASLTTSTDDVEDRLRSLTADTNNLNADVTYWWKAHQGDIAAARFVQAWTEWRDKTYQFIRSWKEGLFKIKLAWNYMDNANQRIAELAEWRRRWEQVSGEKSTAPATIAPPPKPKNGESSGGGPWKWVAVLAAGGLGAMFLAKKIGN